MLDSECLDEEERRYIAKYMELGDRVICAPAPFFSKTEKTKSVPKAAVIRDLKRAA